MAEEGVYVVEPPKAWHKTRLSAEEWFLKNPPHVWRTLEDAVQHYMAAGFEVEPHAAHRGGAYGRRTHHPQRQEPVHA